MKYSILFIALLSVVPLLQAGHTHSTERNLVQQVDSPLQSALNEAADAKREAIRARTELAREKAQRKEEAQRVLKENSSLHISVVGQGVAPMNTTSPAQAYALAKRAAIADAYRAIAEKVKGVRIDGQDLIKDMMVKRSTVRTSVKAMVRNANVVETTFKEGLCEVEMEIIISHSDFAH